MTVNASGGAVLTASEQVAAPSPQTNSAGHWPVVRSTRKDEVNVPSAPR